MHEACENRTLAGLKLCFVDALRAELPACFSSQNPSRVDGTLERPPMVDGISPERAFLLMFKYVRFLECTPRLLGICAVGGEESGTHFHTVSIDVMSAQVQW